MNNIGVMQGRIFPSNLNQLQLFPKKNWQEEIKVASKIGFSQFELLFDKDSLFLNEFSSLKKIEKLNKLEKANKISISSICVDYFSLFKIHCKEHQNHFLIMLKKIIGIAEKTSIKTIIIPYCDSNAINSKRELLDALNFYLIKNIDNFLARKSISIALELNLGAEEVSDCFDQFSFKNIGVCYDLGNAAGNGLVPHEEILKLGNRIIHIHIKDKPVDGPNVMLGLGSVDFRKCMQSLNEINYNKSLILETIYKKHPKDEATINFNFINNIIFNQ